MKKLIIFLILGIFLFSTMGMVSSGEYVNLKFPYNYVQSINAGETTYQNYQIEIPIDVKKVGTFVINAKGNWGGGDVSAKLDTSVGVIDCTPNIWTTSTSEQYEVMFDCTDALTEELNSGELIKYVTEETSVTADEFEVYDPTKINQVLYSPGDVVVYDGAFYECKQQIYNSNGVPPSLPTYWEYLEDVPESNEQIKAVVINGVGLSSTANSQNIFGNIELSLISKDKINAKVHGTEYIPDQRAKIFLQLLDDNNQPINDSTCYASVYYPNNNIFRYKQEMVYVNEGLYSYDFDVPFQAGVYMVSALCTVPGLESNQVQINESFESGGISGGDGWSNSWDLDSCTISTDSAYDGTYSLKCVGDQTPSRQFISNSSHFSITYDFWWRAEGLSSKEVVTYRLTDASGSSHNLLTITEYDADGAWYHEVGTLYTDYDGYNFNGTNNFNIITSGNLENGDDYYLDKLKLTLTGNVEVNSSQYQIIRGSGEVHVTNKERNNYIPTIDSGEVKAGVGSDPFGNLYYNFSIQSQSSQNLSNQNVHVDLPLPFPCKTVENVTIDGVEVDFYGRDSQTPLTKGCQVHWRQELDVGKTYQGQIISENYFKKVESAWLSNSKLNYELIDIACTAYQNETGLPPYVTPYETRPEYLNDSIYSACTQYYDTYYEFNSTYWNEFRTETGVFNEREMDSLNEMWTHFLILTQNLEEEANSIVAGLNLADSYSIAILEDPVPPENPAYAKYFASISSSYLNYIKPGVNETSIANTVWSSPLRTLTDFNFDVNLSSQTMNNLVNSIWTSPTRTLTSFDFNVTLATSTIQSITQSVWEYTNRTLSSFDFQVDTGLNNLTEEDVWNYLNRSLTDFNFTVETGLNNLTVEEIWNYANRNLTEFNFTVDTTDEEVNISEISESVWNFDYRYTHGELAN